MVADFDHVERALIHFFYIAVDRKLCKDSKYLSAGILFNIQEIAGGLASRAVSLIGPLSTNRTYCLQGDCFGVNVLVPGVDPIVE
jgi:hypothetical protein